MKFYSHLTNRKISLDFNSPIDISVPLSFSNKFLNAWGINKAKKNPVVIGDWVGNIKQGGPVNFNNIWFNPHAHVTHTECFGHISINEESINNIKNSYFSFAKLVSVKLKKKSKDFVITKESLYNELNNQFPFDSLIIRTLPNKKSKNYKDYSNQNPPYMTKECMLYIKKLGVKNLLIDLPSVDKEKDDGRVENHKLFFDSSSGGNSNTLTELVYISDEIIDGDYFLNLQIMPIENDAAPSRPILFKINYL
tara:strand:+ start:401 stop:1153 length:753 start_codon:yes stop_codon:yes gene_type:complete